MKEVVDYIWDNYADSNGVVIYVVKKEDTKKYVCFIKDADILPTVEEITAFGEVKENLKKIVSDNPYDSKQFPDMHQWVNYITQLRMAHISDLLENFSKIFKGEKPQNDLCIIKGGIGFLVVDLLSSGLDDSKNVKHLSSITTILVKDDQVSIWNEGETTLVTNLDGYYGGEGYKQILEAVKSALPMSESKHPPKIIKFKGMHHETPKTLYLVSYGDLEERYIQNEQPKEDYTAVEPLRGSRLVFPNLLRTTLCDLWEKRIKTEEEVKDTGVVLSNLPVRIWNWCNFIYPNVMNNVCLLDYSTVENDPENPRNPVVLVERPKDDTV